MKVGFWICLIPKSVLFPLFHAVFHTLFLLFSIYLSSWICKMGIIVSNFVKLLQRSKEITYVRALHRNVEHYSNSNSMQQCLYLFYTSSFVITNTWEKFILGQEHGSYLAHNWNIILHFIDFNEFTYFNPVQLDFEVLYLRSSNRYPILHE